MHPAVHGVHGAGVWPVPAAWNQEADLSQGGLAGYQTPSQPHWKPKVCHADEKQQHFIAYFPLVAWQPGSSLISLVVPDMKDVDRHLEGTLCKLNGDLGHMKSRMSSSAHRALSSCGEPGCLPPQAPPPCCSRQDRDSLTCRREWRQKEGPGDSQKNQSFHKIGQ